MPDINVQTSSPPTGAPYVSVCLVTYHHERFITQAIDGALMQETAFPFEIVIADDCSTDQTGKIARQYAGRYPDQVRVLDRKQNLGANRNFAQALTECHGKYVALLDGDDYWTSPTKLQKQADFLDARDDFAACFHSATVMQEGTTEAQWIARPSFVRDAFGLADILRANEFPTCSAMLRRAVTPPLPEWYCAMRLGDWPLYAMLAEQGSLGFIDEVMGTYRIHGGGSWSGRDPINRLRDLLAAYGNMSRFFQHRQDFIIRPLLAQKWFLLAREYENRGEFAKAKWPAIRAARMGALRMPESRNELMRMLVRFLCPVLYDATRGVQRMLKHGRLRKTG